VAIYARRDKVTALSHSRFLLLRCCQRSADDVASDYAIRSRGFGEATSLRNPAYLIACVSLRSLRFGSTSRQVCDRRISMLLLSLPSTANLLKSLCTAKIRTRIHVLVASSLSPHTTRALAAKDSAIASIIQDDYDASKCSKARTTSSAVRYLLRARRSNDSSHH